MQKYVKSSDEILMVGFVFQNKGIIGIGIYPNSNFLRVRWFCNTYAGCGNSELSEELYSKQNCKLITNIDISENVITRMKKKAEQNKMEMIFEVGDVTKMTYNDERFNTVIGKLTFTLFDIFPLKTTLNLDYS